MFSLFSPHAQVYKLGAEIGIIVLLIALNLRGVKESIMVLAPIFLGFFITHAFLIVYGVNAHAGALSGVVQATWHETLQLSKESGWMFTVALFLRAYSVGAGTYKIGRAHVCNPVTNAHLVSRLLLEKKNNNT